VARGLGGNPFVIPLFLLMAGVLGLTTFAMSRLETNVGVLISLGIVISILVFFKTKIAIYLLIFSMLLSPEFALSGLATSGASLGRGVTFRFDDVLHFLMFSLYCDRSGSRASRSPDGCKHP